MVMQAQVAAKSLKHSLSLNKCLQAHPQPFTGPGGGSCYELCIGQTGMQHHVGRPYDHIRALELCRYMWLTGMVTVWVLLLTYPMMLHRMGTMARGMKACRMVDTTFLCYRQQQRARQSSCQRQQGATRETQPSITDLECRQALACGHIGLCGRDSCAEPWVSHDMVTCACHAVAGDGWCITYLGHSTIEEGHTCIAASSSQQQPAGTVRHRTPQQPTPPSFPTGCES